MKSSQPLIDRNDVQADSQKEKIIKLNQKIEI